MEEEDIITPDEIIDDEDKVIEEDAEASSRFDRLLGSDARKFKLSGMFKDWYLDYASYVILHRAVPHIADGLKPVQRRVLHTMDEVDDGRFTKVANIVGQAMQYHPHGDQSILGALVTLGQKGLLIDCQGNWGNIFTGDANAAPRYIEARLSKFAKEVVFDPKVTPWMTSYDGRKQEPTELPVRFPLLLAQGTEGIGVGLASKILPHNFNELLDASVAILEGKPYEIYLFLFFYYCYLTFSILQLSPPAIRVQRSYPVPRFSQVSTCRPASVPFPCSKPVRVPGLP